MKNILVTGGGGYLGSTLAPLLLERGYRVSVLDPLLYSGDSLNGLARHPEFKLIRGDIRKAADIDLALEEAECVVDLAGIVGAPACIDNPLLARQVNYYGSELLIKRARDKGVKRYLYASSCSVYGAASGQKLLTEKSKLDPLNIYIESKIGTEKNLLSVSAGDFTPCVLRLATLFGLSARPRFDLVVNLLAAQATCRRHYLIYGGNQWRPFLHVYDAARAFLIAVEAPAAEIYRQVYNVGVTDFNYRIIDIGETVKACIPDADFEVTEELADERDYRVLCDKFAKRFDFSPQKDLKDGITEIKDAINLGLIADFEDDIYYNHKYLRRRPTE